MRHFALYYKTVNIRIKYTKVVNFCFLGGAGGGGVGGGGWWGGVWGWGGVGG